MTKGTSATAAKNRYAKKNYDRLAVQVVKGKKELYKELAERQGLALSTLIEDTLDAQCCRYMDLKEKIVALQGAEHRQRKQLIEKIAKKP